MKTILTILILSTSVFANTGSDKILRKYFMYFDYSKTSNLEKSFKIEKRMIDLADQAYDITATVEDRDHKEQLSLIMVYTAMYLLNHNNGAIEGKIDFDTLTQNGSFSKVNDLRDEILARYNQADKYLSLALVTAPGDERIESWYLANLLRMQKYDAGIVDERILDRITEITLESPMFHLFNALTMSSDYDFGEERNKKLFDVVEMMTGKDSPCRPFLRFLRKGDAKKCNTTNKTPYAYQGTSVYLADFYVKQAVKNQADKPRLADKQFGKALGMYITMKIIKPFKTWKWKMRKSLNQRIKTVRRIKRGKTSGNKYLQSSRYLDVYTCSSCHQGGSPSRVLNIKRLGGLIK